MAVKITGMSETVAKLARAGEAIRAQRIRSMERAVRIIETDLKTRTLNATPLPPAVIRSGKKEMVLRRGGQGGLAIRTGGLARSLVKAVIEAEGKVVGTVGIPQGKEHGWVWVHEYGAVIRAKNPRGLAIPVSVQQAGTAARRSRAGKSPGLGGRKHVGLLRPHQVTIPARRPFGNTADRTRAAVIAEFEDGARQFVRRVGGAG